MDAHEPEAFLRGIHLFNRGEFFECHEVLEDIWRPSERHRRFFLQGIIHVAVGLYHWERGNPDGAARQLSKALKKLAGYLPRAEGVDTGRLYRDALDCLERVRRGEPPTRLPLISFSERTPLPARYCRSGPPL
jgi:predicted metal-dependent hydrolase